MKLSKFEKKVCVWCPWIFGAVFIVVGLLLPFEKAPMIKMGIICFSLLYMSIFCIAVLLARIVELLEKKDDSIGQTS